MSDVTGNAQLNLLSRNTQTDRLQPVWVPIMVSRIRFFTFLALVFLVGFFSLETVAWACPTCKESLAHSDPARANMVRGYFWSIIFMMSMPFLILGGLSTLFWWEIRKAKLQKLREAPAISIVSARADRREPVEV